MRASDITGTITMAMGTLLVIGDKMIQAMDHHAPAFGVMIAFLTFVANIYFQVRRRNRDK